MAVGPSLSDSDHENPVTKQGVIRKNIITPFLQDINRFSHFVCNDSGKWVCLSHWKGLASLASCEFWKNIFHEIDFSVPYHWNFWLDYAKRNNFWETHRRNDFYVLLESSNVYVVYIKQSFVIKYSSNTVYLGTYYIMIMYTVFIFTRHFMPDCRCTYTGNTICRWTWTHEKLTTNTKLHIYCSSKQQHIV